MKAKHLRLIFSLLVSNLILEQYTFGQNSSKPYLENTLSPFNIIPQPGSGLKPEYWIRGFMNSIMVKAGLNTTHVFRFGLSDYGENTDFTKIIHIEKYSYQARGKDWRLGYQYNYKNDKRRVVPFISADYCYSTFYQDDHNFPTRIFSNFVTQGILINAGLKHKI